VALFITIALVLGSAAVANPVAGPADGHAFTPTWSPDGKYLAFELNKQTKEVDLFFLPVDGVQDGDAGKVRLPGQAGCSFSSCDAVAMNTTWHPSNGMAVFEASNSGGDYRLYFAKPSGGEAGEMIGSALSPGNLTFPQVSQNGRWLLFITSNTGRGDIATWSPDTGKVAQLTSTADSEAFPHFDRLAERVVFSRTHEDTQDLFELTVGGGEATLLAGGAGDQTRPVYADGGRVVYFTSERGVGIWDVEAVVDGKETTLASNVRLPLRQRPAVTADGKWVAYGFAAPTKNANIGLTRVDGSKTVTLETEYVACGEPSVVQVGGKTLLAFTALPASDAAWRFLVIEDITAQLQ